jgi:AraC family transcriptional regulator of adaptative response/methylated-DNA-[protein]-cysteine methyltransferase
MSLQLSTTETTDDTFWQAVINRDTQFDGDFVYGVRSTRIFCRPTCPARRPRREHVAFFATAEEAIENGFRACKRCRPQNESSVSVDLVQRACAIIDNESEPVSLETLGQKLGVSAGHLQRTFKKVTSVSPKEYANARRLESLKNGLQSGHRVLDSMNDAGFGSSRGLYEQSSSHLGMTPATYKKGGIGATIRFDVVPCWLGFLLVATTDKGLCSVTLGDFSQELEADLRREFPHATVHQDENHLRDAIAHALRVLDGQEPGAQLPLDVQATAFQWRVWQVLQELRRGETLSYAQLAQKIGQPSAARAVARACATNPVALLVPCHRIVGNSGALSGYRWGIERKKKLLERERASN